MNDPVTTVNPGTPVTPAPIAPAAAPVATATPITPAPPTTPAAPTTVVQSQQIGKYQVQVLNDKCIGAASCVAIAPEIFKLNEQNIAEVISQAGSDDSKLLAAQSCPTSAIKVIDTSTGQVVWPQ